VTTAEGACGTCGALYETVGCYTCDGTGVDGHDCGEDSCCCLEPEENAECSDCDGAGSVLACRVCYDEARA